MRPPGVQSPVKAIRVHVMRRQRNRFGTFGLLEQGRRWGIGDRLHYLLDGPVASDIGCVFRQKVECALGQPWLPRGIEQIIAIRLGRVAFQQQLALDQFEYRLADAVPSVGVELKHCFTDPLWPEEEADDLWDDWISGKC